MGSQFPSRTHTLAVWELTLACNLRCSHCGSAAGRPRGDELSTDEALAVVERLVARGIREVTLIGGEATLRPDWEIIARAIVAGGLQLTLQTGGYHIDAAMAERIAATGVLSVGVSLDGDASVHDALRGRPESFSKGLQALRHLRDAGVSRLGVNTQINRHNWQTIPALFDVLVDQGVHGWMLMPTIPMGAALRDQELCLQPHDFEALHELMAILATAGSAHGLAVFASNAMGYFGPYERLMRDPGTAGFHYGGCPAGVGALGLEADGTVKGCPSLPTELYGTGHVLADGLEQLDRLLHQEPRTTAAGTDNPYRPRVEGFCLRCPFACICRGGCTWAATAIQGQRGDNPYCMFRSIALHARGEHEVMTLVDPGGMGPFAIGELAVERHGGDPRLSPPPSGASIDLDAIDWPERLAGVASSFRQRRPAVRDAVDSVLRRHQAFSLLQGRQGVRSLLAEMEAIAMNTPAAASAISNGV